MPPLLADSARTTGHVIFDLVLVVATVMTFVTYRARRQEGESAVGWLIGFIVLCVLVLAAAMNAALGD